MNLSQLRALDAAVRTKSYTKAAQELGISQPAVSQQLRELEKEYQVKLIFRRGKTIEFTPLARRLVRKARICLAFIEDMKHTLRAEGNLQAGTFNIGLSCHNLVMELLAVFMNRYPAVTVNSHIGDSRMLVSKVLDGQLDMAAITGKEPDPRVESFLYSSQRIVAVMSAGNPWTRLTSLDVSLLQNAPMIARPRSSGTRSIFENRLSEQQITPKVVLELDSFDAMLEAVAADIGFAIVLENEFKEDERLRSVPFVGADMHANQYLVCLPEYKELQVVNSFLALAAEARVTKNFSQKTESA